MGELNESIESKESIKGLRIILKVLVGIIIFIFLFHVPGLFFTWDTLYVLIPLGSLILFLICYLREKDRKKQLRYAFIFAAVLWLFLVTLSSNMFYGNYLKIEALKIIM